MITDLNLSCNPIGNEGIEFLKEPLSFQTQTIRNLNISNCEFTAHGAEEIFRAVSATRITKLCMSKNQIGDDKVTTGRMCETLWKNRSIEHLELDECMIRDQGGIGIGEALLRGSALRYCSLRKNDISDEGAIRIAQGIEHDGRLLKELYLGWNEISDTGGEVLGKCLLKNRVLEKLDLSNNKLKNSSATVFIVSLKRNQYIKLLNLDDNMINSQLAKKVQVFIKSNRGKATEQKNEQLTARKEVIQNQLRGWDLDWTKS